MTWLLWTFVFLLATGFFHWQMGGRFRILLLMRRDDSRDYSPKIWPVRIRNTLGSAVNEKGLADKVQVMDVKEIVSTSMLQ